MNQNTYALQSIRVSALTSCPAEFAFAYPTVLEDTHENQSPDSTFHRIRRP
jgi:hypothetical protein